MGRHLQLNVGDEPLPAPDAPDRVFVHIHPGQLEQVGQAAPRTLLVGVDADAFPMSYIEGDSYSGFDVELAREVCSRLGWTAKFISIKAENAYVELSSGNIDVAWGGLALEREDVKYEVTAPYLTNDIVIVTLAQGGAKTPAGLKGDTLAMTVEQKAVWYRKFG